MSLPGTSPVLLVRSQVEPAADLLARAMQEAPDMKFFIGDEEKMLDTSSLRFYNSVIMIGLLYGEVYTTPAIAGVSVWSKPETSSFSPGMFFRTGFLTALLSVGFRPMLRFMNASGYVQKLQQEAISVPHWTLVFLAVEPAQQGKGIGGVLLKPILERADSEGIPCYVESSNERNLTFYKRHGFDIVNQGQVPGGGPQVWVMVRQPVS